jgi:hypothetical protein
MLISQSNMIPYTLYIATIFVPEIIINFNLAIGDLKKNSPSNLPLGFIENFKL